MSLRASAILLVLAASLAISCCSPVAAPADAVAPVSDHVTVGVNLEGEADGSVASLFFQLEPRTPEENDVLAEKLSLTIAGLDGVSIIRAMAKTDSIAVSVTVKEAQRREQVFAELLAIARQLRAEVLEDGR